MIDNFFKKLAKRLYKENDLSDITWAIATTNTHFMELFMKLFKFDEFHCDKPWSIDRENPSESQGSRPDFIVSQEKEYIIENKINDMNYHFSQYAKDFPNSKRGFISAYKLDDEAKKEAKNYKFQIARWQDFIALLQNNLGKFGEDSLLINAYITYVKEVCSIMTFKEVRGIENLSGLYNFNKLVEWVIDNFKKDGYGCNYTMLMLEENMVMLGLENMLKLNIRIKHFGLFSALNIKIILIFVYGLKRIGMSRFI